MTTLPVCLPVAVAVCMVAAAVFAALLPVCGWIDWRERRRTARERACAGAGGPKSPPTHSGRVGAPHGSHSASCAREAPGYPSNPEALSAPESPSGGASPPEPHPTPAKPSQSRTARQETP